MYDVVVIGGGPGGYVAAIRAAQLGLKAAVVEKEHVGGVCLNWGCIPTKALLRNAEILELLHRSAEFGFAFDNLRTDYGVAIDRSRKVVKQLVSGVEWLLDKKNKVDRFAAHARLAGPNKVVLDGDGQTLETKNVILATGARPKTFNIQVDGRQIVTSREILEQRDLPRSLAIMGAGAVGVEFGYVHHSYGVPITLIEALPRILPNEDEEISQALERKYKSAGWTIHTNTRVNQAEATGEGVRIVLSGPQGEQTIVADRFLVAVGISPNVENIGLEEVGVELEHGYVKIDDYMRTTVPGVYAIGDVTGKLALAHVGSAQGVVAAETIAGVEAHPLNYVDMPRATYCQPHVASLGLTEQQARDQGYNVKVAKFPMRASGRALGLGDTDGFVKLVGDARYGEILGAHFIGPEVTELIAEIGLVKMLEGTATELGRTVHPHPTLSESLMEAALAINGESINI
ncbi:MAG TPA: dihydrolipoyl dehydrogenase [Dehalococcoidia bacterium]|nr:dihydrolipoyl dehydrogenase [Dehalococcoidia bacterium]